jgi:hypothetical protein
VTDLELQLRRIETRASMLEHEMRKLEDLMIPGGMKLTNAQQGRLADWLSAIDARGIAILRAHGWTPDLADA